MKLTGIAWRSTGALTVLQLAAEADVKRWVLTHKQVRVSLERITGGISASLDEAPR